MELNYFKGCTVIQQSQSLAVKYFSDELKAYIEKAYKKGYTSIVFICIGTDRLTGDALGPITGYKINGLNYRNIYVHGNLDRPIHAKNLYEELLLIQQKYENPYVIAIDACLGDVSQVGNIIMGEGSLRPGAGLKKKLTPVGNAFVMGVVNQSGWMEFQNLQNTRLNTVMNIADVIANGIKLTLWKIHTEKESSIEYVH